MRPRSWSEHKYSPNPVRQQAGTSRTKQPNRVGGQVPRSVLELRVDLGTATFSPDHNYSPCPITQRALTPGPYNGSKRLSLPGLQPARSLPELRVEDVSSGSKSGSSTAVASTEQRILILEKDGGISNTSLHMAGAAFKSPADTTQQGTKLDTANDVKHDVRPLPYLAKGPPELRVEDTTIVSGPDICDPLCVS